MVADHLSLVSWFDVVADHLSLASSGDQYLPLLQTLPYRHTAHQTQADFGTISIGIFTIQSMSYVAVKRNLHNHTITLKYIIFILVVLRLILRSNKPYEISILNSCSSAWSVLSIYSHSPGQAKHLCMSIFSLQQPQCTRKISNNIHQQQVILQMGSKFNRFDV